MNAIVRHMNIRKEYKCFFGSYLWERYANPNDLACGPRIWKSYDPNVFGILCGIDKYKMQVLGNPGRRITVFENFITDFLLLDPFGHLSNRIARLLSETADEQDSKYGAKVDICHRKLQGFVSCILFAMSIIMRVKDPNICRSTLMIFCAFLQFLVFVIFTLLISIKCQMDRYF